MRPPGELEVVRDVHDRLALGVQTLEQLEHLGRGDGVQVARRLVADDELRVGRERARDRHALLLAARQLCR